MARLSIKLSRQLALLGVTALTAACLSVPAWAAQGAIEAIRYDVSSHQFLIDATGPVKASMTMLNIGGSKRIIIDVQDAEIGLNLPRDSQLRSDLTASMPGVRNVTVNQYSGNGTPIVRILLDISGNVQAARLVNPQGPRLALEVNDGSFTAQPPRQASLPPLNVPATTTEPARRPETTLRPASPQPAASPETARLVREHEREIDALRREMEGLARENRELQAESAGQSQADARIRALQADLDKAQSELARIRLSNDALQRQLDDAAGRNASANDLQSRLAAVNRQLEDLRRENDSLKRQVTASSQPDPALAAKQAEIDRLARRNRELETDLQALQSAPKGIGVDEMKQTIVRMNQRYDELTRENQSLRGRYDELDRNYQSLRSDNEGLRSRATATAGISQAELQELRNQLTRAQASLGESVRTINEQNREIGYLRNQVNTVKAGVDASAREQITKLRDELARKDTRIREMESELATQAAAPQPTDMTGQSQVAALKRQLDKLSRQYQTDVAELNRQLQTREQALDESRAQLRKAEQQVSTGARNQENEVQQLKQQVANLKSELERARQPRIDTVEEVELKDEIARLLRENQALKAKAEPEPDAKQLQTLQTKITTLQAELATARKALEAQTGATTARQPANSKELAAMKKQVDELTRILSDTRRDNADLKTKLANAAAQQPIKTAPATNPEAQREYMAGKTAMAAGETAKAIEQFRKANLLEPDHSQYAIDYGLALAEDRRYADAIEALRRYLQRQPADREAYNQLGKIYLLNDQTEAASEAFSRAISVSTLNNYASALKKQGRMEEAEHVFKTALELDPNDSELLFNLGNLYNSTNRLELARDKYLQAIRIRPDFAEAHYNLGLIYSKMGKNTDAVTHLETFLKLSPNARNAETIRAYVQKLKA